jgi:hypothetical protein
LTGVPSTESNISPFTIPALAAAAPATTVLTIRPQWQPFRLQVFAVCEFHASGFEGGGDLLAVSTDPSTTASPLHGQRPNVGEIGCYDLGPCEDAIADDFLKAWQSTSTR